MRWPNRPAHVLKPGINWLILNHLSRRGAGVEGWVLVLCHCPRWVGRQKVPMAPYLVYLGGDDGRGFNFHLKIKRTKTYMGTPVIYQALCAGTYDFDLSDCKTGLHTYRMHADDASGQLVKGFNELDQDRVITENRKAVPLVQLMPFWSH